MWYSSGANSRSSISLKKSKVSSTNLRNKLQFVNSVKRLVFDLTKIPFLDRLISISRLIVEVLNDQNLLQNRIWLIGFRVMSSFVQVVISQNKLKLLGRITLIVREKQHLFCLANTKDLRLSSLWQKTTEKVGSYTNNTLKVKPGFH